MAGNRSIAEISFHENATISADGVTYLNTNDADTMNIDFMGTGTFTSIVEGKSSYKSDKFDEIMAINLKTYDMSTMPNTFDTWQVELKGWSYIRVRLTAVTGSVTVLARLVG